MKNIRYTLISVLSLLIMACNGSDVPKPPIEEPMDTDFKIMTYNIHYGVGIDGQLNIGRIANVIASENPDVVVLNEVDRNYDQRSNFQDQLDILSKQLNMNYQFQKTTWKSPTAESSYKQREFGHAVLSKYQIAHVSDFLYAEHKTHYHGLLETKININNKEVYFYATHLEVDPEVRNSQINELLQKMSQQDGVKILCGDFNATPYDTTIVKISNVYQDAFAKQNLAFTYKSNSPSVRIDYIFGSKNISFINSRVINSLASDHFPIVSEVVL